MPTDVALGQGYLGDALLRAFPNQYRDAAGTAVFDPQSYQTYVPGAASGQPRATDPDRGRPMVLRDVPGLGPVMVPAGQQTGQRPMGQVSPASHDMAQVVGVPHAMANWQGSSFAGQGDWYGSMFGFGDWETAVKEAIAQDELNLVNSAVRGLADKLVEAIESRNGVARGYREAQSLYQAAVSRWGLPLPPDFTGPPAPGYTTEPAVYAALTARQTAVEGVRLLARKVQTLGFLDRAFTAISAALGGAGLAQDADGVNMTITQLRRFVLETDDILAPLAPEYMRTKQQILAAAQGRWAASGIDPNAMDSPGWWKAYVAAADTVVAVPDAPETPAGLGSPLAGLLVALIWAVAFAAAAVVAMHALDRLLVDRNLLARQAHERAAQYADLASREDRLLFESLVSPPSNMPPQNAQAVVNAQRAKKDEEHREKEKEIQARADKGLDLGIEKLILPAAIIAGVVVAGPPILKALGVGV